jgi:hypothetical protein
VILIGYEDQEGDSLLAVESLTAALRSSAIDIHDRIIVRGHRWGPWTATTRAAALPKDARCPSLQTCPASSLSS